MVRHSITGGRTKYATRWPPAQIILRLFASGGWSGTSTPSPPLAAERVFLLHLISLSLSSSFTLLSSSRSSFLPLPPLYKPRTTTDGVVSSAGNQGCDKQTLYPRAALLLNYKIPALTIGAEAFADNAKLSPSTRTRALSLARSLVPDTSARDLRKTGREI